MNDYQHFIFTSRYARWLEHEQRRETWEEAVDRYMRNVAAPIKGTELYQQLKDAILSMEVLPSMRALATAGPALDECHVGAYNCAYAPIKDVRIFSEILYILMRGTGVGYSVERQYVGQLPVVPESLAEHGPTLLVEDSKEGWAEALRMTLEALYSGFTPKFDLSLIRPKGSRLKTFGGRASGPDPLRKLLDFVVHTFQGAEGRKLTSLECHDILCMIGDSVVSGGVRRSALLSLSNLSDDRMRHAKAGDWWRTSGHRALANNSVAYTEKPEFRAFMDEMSSLYSSYNGERGIFFRNAADKAATRYGKREGGKEWGTNP